ncbi:MAG: hypothetical protein Q4A58_07950 [Fusobacterium sp.]|nr:hypothetical protein [Fusobacterium sp.]
MKSSVVFLKYSIGILAGILAYYGVVTLLFEKEFNFWLALTAVCLSLFFGFLGNKRKKKKE